MAGFPEDAKRKGSIHPGFAKRPMDLKAQAKNIADAYKQEAQRNWQIPGDPSPPAPAGLAPIGNVDDGGAIEVDLLDVANLHVKAFERPEMNANYDETMASVAQAGTTGDMISLKLQIDYVATEERAFRTRHMTVCRSIAHAAGRRLRQSTHDMFDNVVQQAANALRNADVPINIVDEATGTTDTDGPVSTPTLPPDYPHQDALEWKPDEEPNSGC